MSSSQQIIKSPLSNLLQKIDNICVLCTEASDAQILLKNSLEQTLALLGSQSATFFIPDNQTKKLIIKIAIGIDFDGQKHLAQQLEQGTVEKITSLKEPLLVENTPLESYICSPLLIKDQLLGVITISNKISHKPFTQRELQLFKFISNQIALNYHRISMTHQLGKATLETSSLKKQIESQERLVSLGKLAGGIAHEFNNPLDGVMRYTKLCLSRADEDEVLREYLIEIQMGLKRMANIVKNLLACARQSPGSAHKVDLHKTIEQALKELYPYLASKNIHLVKNLTPTLSQITDWGVERIISNLVKNAIDAIDKNGTIEITTSLDNDLIKLQISDTGRGIADKNLDKIFEPFFTTKGIDQGCGLGLTVVNEIVKYYNGQIDVKSTLGQGTTFTVKLPLAT
ncbi:MAG: GAF domain-containing sensor histidine kinase [Candidatus Omnitrophica bacterium]|nr:GAF domain-containing sensor histidine kinase [Candidatus Omnitrophota bacterium]